MRSVRLAPFAPFACVVAASLSMAACASAPPPPADYPEPRAIPTTAATTDEDDAEDVAVGVDADDDYADTDPSALTDLRAPLDGHGTWVDDETYGTVWLPAPEEVGPDFEPYVSAGRWVYDDGYVWASDYPWGWVPFHYGRWLWIPNRGWAWIPGRAYAGAWVTWRVSDDGAYLGWAPLPPVWVWHHGVAVGIHAVPPAPFVFCPRGDVFAPVVATRIVRGERAPEIGRHTRPYVAASPTVARRPFAPPAVKGPPPASMGIDPSRVARPSVATPGVGRAQQYARPSTAQPMGAHPPSPHVIRIVPPQPARPTIRPATPPPIAPRARPPTKMRH